MLNIVADKEGAGAAVLIRSCAPISGNGTLEHLDSICTLHCYHTSEVY